MNTKKLYQISTLNALMLGDYKGAVKVGDLLKVANIGIGTYDGLNGEAIFFNGKAYDGLATGEVKEMNKDDSLPFATVAKFDENVKENIISFNSMNDFKEKMEQFIEGNKNYFYMIKIEGKFNVRVRSCFKQEEPYKPLYTVAKDQREFEYKDEIYRIIRSPEYEREIGRKDFGTYKNTYYIDNTFTPNLGETWYYKIIPVSTTGFYNTSVNTVQRVLASCF